MNRWCAWLLLWLTASLLAQSNPPDKGATEKKPDQPQDLTKRDHQRFLSN